MGLFVKIINSLLKIGLSEGIQASTVVICCVTKAYTESLNCKKEISYAETNKKPLVVLMLEKLDTNKIGAVGFIITPLVRQNVFNTPNLLHEWSGNDFEGILKSIRSHVRPGTGIRGRLK